jgi:hypothetical protein
MQWFLKSISYIVRYTKLLFFLFQAMLTSFHLVKLLEKPMRKLIITQGGGIGGSHMIAAAMRHETGLSCPSENYRIEL